MLKRLNVFRPSLVVCATAAMLAGCGVTRVVTPPVDDLAAWSATPLAPSANLAAIALGPNSACNGGDAAVVSQILVQDRRTASTAAFLLGSPTTFGSCLLSEGSGSSGGSGPSLEALVGQISIDDQGSGTVGERTARKLGGRVVPDAVRVVVELGDGRQVLASLVNGWWLAWWPDTTPADRVAAYDVAGTEIGSIDAGLPVDVQ